MLLKKIFNLSKILIKSKRFLIFFAFLIVVATLCYLIFVQDLFKKSGNDVSSPAQKALVARQSEIDKIDPGFIEKKTKSIDESLKNIDKESSNPDQKAIAYLFVANDYESVGDYANAIKMYEKVLESNDPVYLKNTHIAIGDLYKKLDEKNNALDSYNKAKENILKLSIGEEQKSMLKLVEQKIKELG